MTVYDVKAGWTDDRTVTQPQPTDHSMIQEKKPKARSCSLGVFECLTVFWVVRYCNLLCGHFCNLELLNLTHYFSPKWNLYVKKRNWHLILGNNRKLYSKQSEKHNIGFPGFTFHNGERGHLGDSMHKLMYCFNCLLCRPIIHWPINGIFSNYILDEFVRYLNSSGIKSL